jgi:hypothetical protein
MLLIEWAVSIRLQPFYFNSYEALRISLNPIYRGKDGVEWTNCPRWVFVSVFIKIALEIGREYVTITAENRNSEKHHVLK